MTRKLPNARRAVALALFAGFLLAANASALVHPDPVQAETAGIPTPGRRPLPGDPNTPDEGGRITVSATEEPKQIDWVVYWIKDVALSIFRAR